MKFTYQYRTSDNAIHRGVVVASNRDAAFAELKSRGIRASRVEDAPGLSNKLLGKGKRWMAIGVLSVVVIASIVIIRSRNCRIRSIEASLVSPMPRHQVYGDPDIMAELALGDYADVFSTELDRLLVRYAQPGREAASAIVEPVDWQQAEKDLERPVEILPSDLREVRELKRIVAGMREELKEYVAAGGTVEKYARRLKVRLDHEVEVQSAIHSALSAQAERLKAEDADPALIRNYWIDRNRELRNMGLKTVPFPAENP